MAILRLGALWGWETMMSRNQVDFQRDRLKQVLHQLELPNPNYLAKAIDRLIQAHLAEFARCHVLALVPTSKPLVGDKE